MTPFELAVEEQPASTRGRTGLIAIGFAGLGIPAGALGVAWPEMRVTFGRSTGELGVLIVVFGIGYFSAGAATGRLTKRWTIGHLLTVAMVVFTAGAALLAAAPSWWLLVVAQLITGAAGGLLDATLNTAAALTTTVATLNLLHACFAVGAMLGPLAVSGALALGSSWRLAFALIAVVLGVIAVAFWRADASWPLVGADATSPRPVDETEAVETVETTARRRVNVVIAVVVAMAFVYVGTELAAGQWSASLFDERGLSSSAAGLWVAGFWAALAAGRVVAGTMGRQLTPDHLLDISLTICLAGSVLFWWAPSNVVGCVGLLVVGAGMAAMFPSFIAVTPVRVGPARTPTAIGLQVAAAAAGAVVLPGLVGVLAETVGLEVLGPVLVGGTVVLIGLHATLRRL